MRADSKSSKAQLETASLALSNALARLAKRSKPIWTEIFSNPRKRSGKHHQNYQNQGMAILVLHLVRGQPAHCHKAAGQTRSIILLGQKVGLNKRAPIIVSRIYRLR